MIHDSSFDNKRLLSHFQKGFPVQLKKIMKRFKKTECSIDLVYQTTSLVVNLVKGDYFHSVSTSTLEANLGRHDGSQIKYLKVTKGFCLSPLVGAALACSIIKVHSGSTNLYDRLSVTCDFRKVP